MKKVMVVIPALGSGGAERLVVALIAKMDPKQIQIKLVVLYPYENTDNASFVKDEGIDVVYLNKKHGADLSVVKKLKREIVRFRPDIIHTHLYTVAYVLLAAPIHIPKYHTVHNVASKEASGLRRIINWIAFKIGNFTPVAISPYCKKTIEEVYFLKSDNIPCIMNGVDTNKYKSQPTCHEGFVYINVGRLQAQKNQALLIKAFSKVHIQNPDTKLVVAGEGELRGELESLIKEYGLEGCVSMPGLCHDIEDRLNSADVFVQSSDYEGLPISGLEAMACGLPVISTKAGGTIDIVSNNINGFLTDIGDIEGLAHKMNYLAKNREICKAMGCESRKIAEMYDIERCAREYQNLFLNT